MSKKKKVVAQTEADLHELVASALQNQGPCCDLNHIDVSEINEFDSLFKNTPFNGDISRWNTANAVTFRSMFENCPFNGDIGRWKTGNVFNMCAMFLNSGFNGDISQWNTSSVTCTNSMFEGSPFNGDISKWSMKKVEDMRAMFKDSAFNNDLSRWRTPALRHAHALFQGSPFNGDVSVWKPRQLRSAGDMFNTPSFQQDLSAWVLPQHCTLYAMVHAEYCGVLPQVENRNVHEAYGDMFGCFESIAPYAKRTAFSRVHADLLMANVDDCSWASPELLDWAKTHEAMGCNLGLSRDERHASMLARYHLRHATTCGIALPEHLLEHSPWQPL